MKTALKLYSQTYPSDLLETLHSPEASVTPVLILPGLFGSTANWRGFAKQLSDYSPVIVLDQRNHGRSPHADSHNYFDMASDLLKFLDDHNIQKIKLCGHSMGGKTAMVFSLLHPERVEQLAVLDIAPVTYTHTHAPYLEALIDLDLDSLNSRSEAEKRLKSLIPDTAIRLFLLQSLAGSVGSFEWRLNLTVLLKDMPNILSFPSEKLAQNSKLGDTSESGVVSSSVDAIFVNGSLSDYVDVTHSTGILERFPKASFETVEGAAHWLHAEKPHEVLSVLLTFYDLGIKND